MALPELGSAAASRVGRHFDVATFLPTLLCVSYVALAVGAAPWSGHPVWSASLQRLATWETLGTLLAATFALAVVLHPLQFWLTQILEGYWGNSPTFHGLAVARIRAHRRQQRELLKTERKTLGEIRDQVGGKVSARIGDEDVPWLVAHRAARRAAEGYPEANSSIMPTRLGNVLRKAEWEGGSQYGLPAIVAAPYLVLTAPAHHVEHIHDQRTTLDRAVLMVWLSGAATGATVVLFWRCGLWMLIALLPYVTAWAAYRGAVAAAVRYGRAVAVVLDLNRFGLYEALHVSSPPTSKQERDRNPQLQALLSGQHVDVTYTRTRP